MPIQFDDPENEITARTDVDDATGVLRIFLKRGDVEIQPFYINRDGNTARLQVPASFGLNVDGNNYPVVL